MSQFMVPLLMTYLIAGAPSLSSGTESTTSPTLLFDVEEDFGEDPGLNSLENHLVEELGNTYQVTSIIIVAK